MINSIFIAEFCNHFDILFFIIK